MSNGTWFVLIGGLLLVVGFTAVRVKQLAITSAMIYLFVGLVVGPSGFALFHFNPLKEAGLLEVITEIAVLISLFAAGVKMPVPFQWAFWQRPLRLGFVSIVLTIALVALFAFYILGLPLGAAILLGAIVAPTDPVLATDIQVRGHGDKDSLRFSLTCEAGINDGSAFPFVMLGLGLLGLHDIGAMGVHWVVWDVCWATFAAIAIGYFGGAFIALFTNYLRNHQQIYELLYDFIGLGLIALVYGISLWLHAWGFLAVFVAAVALRQTELQLAVRAAAKTPSVELQIGGKDTQRVSEASLVFKEHLERLSEVVLIILVGGTLFIDSWSYRSVGLAVFLFFVARPISVYIGLIGTASSVSYKNLVSWFGVRGIGSLYYLMYAIGHGLEESMAVELIHLTLIVITLSILLHGISVKPLMWRFWNR